jgi:hypothetical protein
VESVYFPPGTARGIIAEMADNPCQQARDNLLADPASARTDPVAIQADALRKLLAARSALAIARAWVPTSYANPATAARR